jgi:branched-chain amino acid transport system substrate-binding protein
MLQQRWTRAFACLGALAIIAAGCGGDDSGSSDDTTATTAAPAATTAAPAATTAAPADATTSPTTSGGTTGDDAAIPEETGPADTSLDPVKIGFVNQSEGTPSFPGPLAGAKGAIEYINTKLGGIDGHPVELVDCNTGLDPDSNQQCAQQMVNNDEVNVVTTQFVLGSDAFWPVLEQSDLVALEGTPLGPADYTSPAAIAYTPGGAGIVVGLGDYAVKVLGAKSMTVVAEANNGGQGVIDSMKAAPQLAGITIDAVLAGGADTDLAGALQTNDNDVYVLVTAAGTCTQVAKALQQIGSEKPVLAVSSCGDPAVISEVGDGVSGWLVGAPSVLPGLVPADPELELYSAAMETAGLADQAGLTSASQTFGQFITLAQIGDSIGFDNLSRASWKDALLAFPGPMFLGPRNLSCPSPVLPALCTTETRIMEINDDGSFTDVVPGPYDAYAS